MNFTQTGNAAFRANITCDEKLVEAHGRIDGNLPSEVIFDFIFLDGFRGNVGNQLR